MQLVSWSTESQLELYFLKSSYCTFIENVSCQCYFYFGYVVRIVSAKNLRKFTLWKLVGKVQRAGLAESKVHVLFNILY